MQRENVQSKAAHELLGQGVEAFGQVSVIEEASDLLNPSVMEVMKDAIRNSRPVVNRHGKPSLAGIHSTLYLRMLANVTFDRARKNVSV